MMTFKQLEAVYWVVKLGSFSAAAQRLHTTQSAVSKRVHELETLFNVPIFDRTLRSARLTDKGEEMYAVAVRMLRDRDEAVERFQRPEVTERRLRLGVTELTAMTWLPRLIGLVHTNYPRVAIEPDVDSSLSLRDKLLADELDLAIIPEVPDDGRVMSRPVGKVENVWMCKPGMLEPDRVYRLHELATHLLLTQGSRSGTGLSYERWFKSFGITLTKTITSNNLIAIIAMTVSGLGISFLPRKCLQPVVEAGLLSVVRVTPSLPEIQYTAIYKGEQRSSLIASIVLLAHECCDFSRALNTSQ